MTQINNQTLKSIVIFNFKKNYYWCQHIYINVVFFRYVWVFYIEILIANYEALTQTLPNKH